MRELVVDMGTRIWGTSSHQGLHRWGLVKVYGGICKRCKERTGKDYYKKLKFHCQVRSCSMFEIRKHVHVR